MDSKRDNTYCLYLTDDSYNFGRIQLFVLTTSPYAIVKKLEGFDQSIMNQLGHPCRPSLQIYKETDLLNHYIVPVQHATTNVCAISGADPEGGLWGL